MMSEMIPSGELKFRKRKITIVVAVCPKCKGDMLKRRYAKTAKRYVCMECNYKCEVK